MQAYTDATILVAEEARVLDPGSSIDREGLTAMAGKAKKRVRERQGCRHRLCSVGPIKGGAR